MTRKMERYWRRILDRVAAGRIDTWDYQWEFACWLHGGSLSSPASISCPISGSASDSTHTRAGSPLANMPLPAHVVPIKHPAMVQRNSAADDFSARHIYKSFLPRLRDKARHDPWGLLQQARQAGTAALSCGRSAGRSSDA